MNTLDNSVREGLARDEGAGAEAPAAVPVPPRFDEVQDEPTNAAET